MSPDTAQGSEQQDPATVPEGGPAAETPREAEHENTESSEPGTPPEDLAQVGKREDNNGDQ